MALKDETEEPALEMFGERCDFDVAELSPGQCVQPLVELGRMIFLVVSGPFEGRR
ncbi:hypothetical protein [Streptomyces sp. NPDC018036]|uniref:hypothetical protein n=1 Tax=Streptomyces sp. NPDC018036 TaxID=3365035 RepID=UPI0037A10AF6